MHELISGIILMTLFWMLA